MSETSAVVEKSLRSVFGTSIWLSLVDGICVQGDRSSDDGD